MEKINDSLLELVNIIGLIILLVEGLFFDVWVEIELINFVFMVGFLEMYIDLFGEEVVFGVQFLYCFENLVEGGLLLFFDGVVVVEVLWVEDLEVFDLLVSYDILFFYCYDKWDYWFYQCVIEIDLEGCVIGVMILQYLQDNMDLFQVLLDIYYLVFIKFLKLM